MAVADEKDFGGHFDFVGSLDSVYAFKGFSSPVYRVWCLVFRISYLVFGITKYRY